MKSITRLKTNLNIVSEGKNCLAHNIVCCYCRVQRGRFVASCFRMHALSLCCLYKATFLRKNSSEKHTLWEQKNSHRCIVNSRHFTWYSQRGRSLTPTLCRTLSFSERETWTMKFFHLWTRTFKLKWSIQHFSHTYLN